MKEPVKELLRRKRGHASSGATVPPTAVRAAVVTVCVCMCVHVNGMVRVARRIRLEYTSLHHETPMGHKGSKLPGDATEDDGLGLQQVGGCLE